MLNINEIKFGGEKPTEIFSDIAQRAAQHIKQSNNVNKTTQLRKFYDELAMWNDRVQLARENKENKFQELAPFIKMLKAKVAYARGRKHVDDHFLEVFNRCIDQANNVETLRDAKLFMEAVMGFCKLEEI
ncbi:type III-A CRISPR-associated protein Csm2 [Haemophilus sp. HMSC71H05]|jgi:CRISPR-associated protein, csm2 family|uniref:type III-A CRISPR-associated protein Csm2 n=1 Tax=Haemophilus sp. HMSC71H05 TaxID=1608898 RepID=UPI0008A8FC3D|nr:type III-A CRISPR-associated protein Csm2 [Haemophilus sp. HMSC71H05]MBS4798066.1 type III-A CRISPR-associated protein Csm2 [Haemophilus parainfluenzae]MDU7655277.1 type III-A CRISPR-associated protein Csm2 [Haemophilus parainfluenzae]OHR70432.1 type III-A CRISPR-associated protein Csm2 [Haemophilus sp. HMSC71H05]